MSAAPTRCVPARRRHWLAALLAAAAAGAALAPAAGARVSALGDDGPTASCAAKLDALDKVVARARSGVIVPAGAIEPPALSVGRPAEVLVRLGADPLGLAAALGIEPARFWATAAADVLAAAPGVGARGRIQADGSARLRLTPPSAGPVRMRMYVPGKSFGAAGCGLGAALVRPGGAPGSPVLQVAGGPTPPPDPGGEPSPTPEPAPVPAPEPQP
jgi:hypothetical protein